MEDRVEAEVPAMVGAVLEVAAVVELAVALELLWLPTPLRAAPCASPPFASRCQAPHLAEHSPNHGAFDWLAIVETLDCARGCPGAEVEPVEACLQS